MTAPTDPRVIAAIEVEFSETVKEAAKLAIDRMLGKVPPPVPIRGRIVDDNSIVRGGVGGWNR